MKAGPNKVMVAHRSLKSKQRIGSFAENHLE